MSHNNSQKPERLQKILSQAGTASRREAEKMILSGRVRVNGEVVTQLGVKANLFQDHITIDDKPIMATEKKVYYLFHKPVNVMVTRRDPQGRPIIYDYLKDISERVNPVGRLDFDSGGLILLTNDGELQARLTHPKHGIPKIYQVKVTGRVLPGSLKKLGQGIDIGGYVTQKCDVRIFKENPHNTWLEITLKEGKNRQIRRMVEGIGHKVLRLVRVGLGPLSLNNLEKGSWRPLTPFEIKSLVD